MCGKYSREETIQGRKLYEESTLSRDHLIESLTQTRQVDIVIFQPIMLGHLPDQNVNQPSMYHRLLESTY